MNRFNYALGSKLDRNRFNGYHFTRQLSDGDNTLTEFTTFEGLHVQMLTCDAGTRSICFLFQDGSGFGYALGNNSKVLSKHVFEPDSVGKVNHRADPAVPPAASRRRVCRSVRTTTSGYKSITLAESAT